MIWKLPKQLLAFINSAFQELKYITFPSRKETFKLGSIVISTSLIFALGLYFLDWFFQVLRNLLTTIRV
jgi:preprotein translocase SecE subunit